MSLDYFSFKITKLYPDFRLEAGLTINEGEFFALIGPSGCGKTTLLRLLAGLEKIDQGFIIMNGREITNLTASKRPIGLVFQDYALFPHLNVIENVAFGLNVNQFSTRKYRERLNYLVELFELSNLTKRPVHQLSGGERQRVALARALAPEPAVLLLDEPFAALDYGLRQRLRKELKTLQRQLGFTAIFVTHQQEEALAVADRLGVMNQGHLIQVGPAPEVYNKPIDPFIAAFLGEVNLIPCQVISEFGYYYAILENNIRLQIPNQPTGQSGAHWLMLRPEDLKLTLTEDTIWNGTVINCDYLGYAYRLELEVESGLNLKMFCLKETAAIKIGATIGVGCNNQALQVLPRDLR